MQTPLPKMFVALSLYSLVLCSVTLMARAAHAESAEAASHFEAGVRAFEEQRFADAALAFERSYQVQPAFQVLYNLGTVYAALGRPVEAVDAFDRYLRLGGPEVAGERRAEVERELDRQRMKLGQIEILVNETGAEIQLDAKLVGRAPLQRVIAVATGRHVLEVSLAGFQTQRSELNVAPGETASFAPTLVRTAPAVPAAQPLVVHATPSRVGFGQRIAGYALGGAGLATAAAGVVVIARGQAEHLDAVRKAKAGDRPEAERMESAADHKKIIGYTVTSIGGAALLGGIVLLLSAPSAPAANASARTHVLPWAASSAGLVLEGLWP